MSIFAAVIMNFMEQVSFLFDLDGVIFDTEGQYSVLWSELGERYFSDRNFGDKVKGQTLRQIFNLYFHDDPQAREEVAARLYEFESRMTYSYIPGVEQFLAELKSLNCRTAVVTSSDRTKMQKVYRAHPEMISMFTRIFTGEDFARSKPAPDCYLQGMRFFGTEPGRTYIFEDSFNGLRAAKDSGGKVIALATTNSREEVSPYADLVIDDFVGMTVGQLLRMQ